VSSKPVARHQTEPDPVAEYAERLGVPLRWWVLAAIFLATLVVAFAVSMPAVAAMAASAALSAVTVAVLLGYGRVRVAVHDEVFQAGAASIPVALLGEPVVLDPAETRRVAGVDADARAYLLLRPYLKRAVRVRVDDPADPTPYWLVSTRRPDRLVAALSAAIRRSRAA
jgi:Protein of unknown function (DUF3093)